MTAVSTDTDWPVESSKRRRLPGLFENCLRNSDEGCKSRTQWRTTGQTEQRPCLRPLYGSHHTYV